MTKTESKIDSAFSFSILKLDINCLTLEDICQAFLAHPSEGSFISYKVGSGTPYPKWKCSEESAFEIPGPALS